jgi:SAM-dependent methyltransferase
MERAAVKVAPTRRRDCPVCGDRSGQPFLDGSINRERLTGFSYASRKDPEFMCFSLTTCANCGLVYVSCPPADLALEDSYAEADFDASDEAGFAAKTYIRLLRPWIDQLPGKRQAVDIGTGNGALLPLLLAAGFETVLGIEPSHAAIAAAPLNIRNRIRQGMFSIDLLSGEEPDLVCAFQTLEHVEAPLTLLRNVHSILQPGGMVALAVHDWEAPVNRLLGRRSPIIDIEHLQLFNKESLGRLIKESSFLPLGIHTFWNTYPLKYWLRLLSLPSTLKRALLSCSKTAGLSDLPLALPVGNVFAVGVKEK